jgi:dTDP-D-glucose 4,6-dehydratase
MDIEAKNRPWMYITDHQEHFKRVKNMGYLGLNFRLPTVNDSKESIFRYFEYDKTRNRFQVYLFEPG